MPSLRHTLSIIFIIFSCSMLAGKYIRAQILQEDGKPIPQARISDGKKQLRSAEDGSFGINSTADSLFITKLGFAPRSFATANVPSIITLQSTPIELPTIVITQKYVPTFYESSELHSVSFSESQSLKNLQDLVSAIPALSTNDTALQGERKTISILGALSRHTLVMIDGIPQNVQGETYDLSQIKPQSIAKIEIIKNNASAYGGASAIGGIIHIITKKDNIEGAQSYRFTQDSGSYQALSNTLEIAHSSAQLAYRFLVSQSSADNNFTYRMPDWWNGEDNNNYERKNNHKSASTYEGFIRTSYKDLHLSYKHSAERFRKGLPGPVNFLELYENAYLTGFNLKHELRGELTKEQYNLQIIHWQRQDDTVYDNTRAENTFLRSNYRQRLHTSGYKTMLALGKGFWGISLLQDYSETVYRNQNYIFPQNSLHKVRSNFGSSAKAGIDLDLDSISLKTNLLGRYDKTPDKGYFTYRLEQSLGFYDRFDLSLGATLGSSFSLPSIYDLYWKGDAQAIGNPDLKPEQSWGYQTWLKLQKDALQIKLSRHYNSIDSLIQWQQVSMNGPAWKPFNIAKTEIENYEAELFYRTHQWLSYNANLLVTNAKDVSQNSAGSTLNKWMMYTPRHKFSHTMELARWDMKLWLRHSYTGKQWTTRDNLIDPLKSYHLLDSGFSVSHTESIFNFDCYINIYNLSNQNYQIHAYVPQPGTNWTLGLSAEILL